MPSPIEAVPLSHVIALSAILFMIGTSCVLLRKNVIVMLMGIELMLNAVNLSFVTFSKLFSDPNGQVAVFFVIAVAAAEAAIGLAIIVSVFRKFNGVEIKLFEHLKG